MQNKMPVYILKQLNVSPELYDAKYLYAFQNLLFHFFFPLEYNMWFYIIKIKDESFNSRMAFK